MLEHFGVQLLESCSFHWIFDVDGRRFRRTPRDAGAWFESSSGWTDYAHLEVDEARACFAVDLDESRTRVLRAWLHADPCGRCGRDGESTGDLQLRIQWWKERLRVRDPRFLPRDGGHPLRPYGGWPQPEDAA